MELLTSLVNNIKLNLKKYAILGLILLLGLFGFKACRKLQKKQDSDTKSTVLAPDQKEKIVVDPTKHTITITTKKSDGTTSTQTTFLPDRPTSITEDNNGKLTVVDHKFGTEVRPYLGVGGSLDGTARVHVGTDLWYFHKLDLGTGLDFNAGVFKQVSDFHDTRLSINASYNIYSNTSLAVSVDNRKFVGLFVKVRL